MTEQEFKDLKEGDVVTHVAGSPVYMITGDYGSRKIATRTIDLTNPSEWKRVNNDSEKLFDVGFKKGYDAGFDHGMAFDGEIKINRLVIYFRVSSYIYNNILWHTCFVY